MAKRSGSGITKGSSNTFVSDFGFSNVGNKQILRGIGGVTVVGTITPSIGDVQDYFDTGIFDSYGSNNSAKKTIVRKIAEDMNGRGFDMQISEDGVHLLPDGNTAKSISITKSGKKWKAKASTSSGIKEPNGMKGALKNATRRR